MIGRRASSDSPEVDAGRLRGMLERALAVVLLALLPMALGQFPISGSVVWLTSGGILFVASPALNWSLLYRLRQLPSYRPGRSWVVSAQLTLAIELALLVAGFFGRIPLESAYGMALLLELFTVAGMFLRVVASITASRTRPPA